MGIKRGTMKFPFFKSMLVAGALMLAWNCTDNTTVNPANLIPNMAENVQVLDQDGQKYYITEDGSVFDEQWNAVGHYADRKITDDDGNPIVENIDDENLSDVKVVTTDDGQKLVVDGDGKVTDTEGNDVGKVDDNGDIVDNNGDIIAENPNKTTESSAEASNPTSTANQQTVTSSASNGGNNNQNNNTTSSASNGGNNNQNNNTTSSASNGSNNQTQNSTASTNCEGKCYDSVSKKCVEYWAQGLTGAHGEQYSYNNECVLQCWHDPNQKACADLGVASNPNTNPNPNPNPGQSSSSQQQQVPSSSSQQQQQQQPSSASQYSGSAQLPKVIDGNEKTGYATRYWDSCKPHCAWSGKGGPIARTCQTNGVSQASVDDASVCDGGNAGTCFDQTPQIVNDTIAYAFAATPGGGNDCGKCYMLTFTGNGSSSKGSSTPSSNSKIKGKHLIVMASNVGYDVGGGQFDLMIPGGGPGAFNGCGKMNISCAGAQYGGFLTTCNFDKNCLINMCKQEYSNSSLQNGCLFLANWMEGADNPEVKYVQVECPSALTAKY